MCVCVHTCVNNSVVLDCEEIYFLFLFFSSMCFLISCGTKCLLFSNLLMISLVTTIQIKSPLRTSISCQMWWSDQLIFRNPFSISFLTTWSLPTLFSIQTRACVKTNYKELRKIPGSAQIVKRQMKGTP